MERIFNPYDKGSCSTIIVGKAASTTGYVLVGHSEDDYDCTIQVHKVPRIRHKDGETLSFADGSAVIPQVEETYAYQWSEYRCEGGISFADGFLNEWGLLVVSNACRPSKLSEEEPQLDGMGYALRRLVAERARTAREAVEVAAQLVSTYGYFSGRCYQFVDKDEAWVFQVPTGNRYVAKRVPDDHVYFIPNHFTIHEVDWSDTEHKNYYFSPDLAEYPIRRGWYTPAVPGDYSDFDFAAAYQDGKDREYNMMRTRQSWPLLIGELPAEWRPFSHKAPHKLGPKDLKKALRSHFEGTPDDYSEGYSRNPHLERDPCTLCNTMTAETTVVVFHEIPALTCTWRASPKPCITPYVPWYLGNTAVPQGYSWLDPTLSQATHFMPAASELRIDFSRAYWSFRVLQYFTEFDYKGTHAVIQQSMAKLEEKWEAEAPLVEECYKKMLAASPEMAADYLTSYTAAQAQLAWDWANEMIQQLGEDRILQNSSTRIIPQEYI